MSLFDLGTWILCIERPIKMWGIICSKKESASRLVEFVNWRLTSRTVMRSLPPFCGLHCAGSEARGRRRDQDAKRRPHDLPHELGDVCDAVAVRRPIAVGVLYGCVLLPTVCTVCIVFMYALCGCDCSPVKLDTDCAVLGQGGDLAEVFTKVCLQWL